MIVYGDKFSGNCYKIQLCLSFLDQVFTWYDVDILAGDTQKPEFLSKNPNGKIPMIELDDGRILSESNAILTYLGDGTDLIPKDMFDRAKMYQWMFFEQYSHEPTIAVARFIQLYQNMPADRLDEYKKCHQGGIKALSVMEQQLNKTPYLVGQSMTLADIALFAYTHVAHQGGFDLTQFPTICVWIDRIKSKPKFSPMIAIP